MSMAATRLDRLVALAPALRLGPVPWPGGRPRCVVVMGPSAAGKTSLVNALRDSALVKSGQLVVPKRIITRPRRANDSTVENEHVSREEFQALVASRAIEVHWERSLGEGRIERYGFAAPEATSKDPKPLPVYSANDALVEPGARRSPEDLLDGSLIVGLGAPADLRAQRLRRRSPDLGAEELERRLASDGVRACSFAHLCIDTSVEPVVDLARALERVVASLLD